MPRRGQRHSSAPAPGAGAGAPPILPAAIIFAGALALRLLYVSSIGHALFFEHLQTEPLHYHQWATLILDGPRAPRAPFEQAPGYPYFVAAIYALFGRSVSAVARAQAVLDAVSCALMVIAGTCGFGRRAGIIAGVLAALYGPFIYFTGELLPSTLFVCVAIAAMTVALLAAPPDSSVPVGTPFETAAQKRGLLRVNGRTSLETPSTPFGLRRLHLLRSRLEAQPAYSWAKPPVDGRRWWAAAGCLWGAALVVRSEAVFAFPFVLLDAWRRGGRAALWRTAVPIGLVIAAFASINAAATSQLVLFTTSGGVNLWLGNNPDADGVNPFVYGALEDVEHGVRAVAASSVEMDHLFRQRALAFWRDDPAGAARLLLKKFLWTWTNRELPNTSDIDWETAQSWVFQRPVFPLSFGMILPLAVAGLLLLVRQWRDLGLLAALLVIGLGTSLVFFTNARFRLIMVPALLLLAAAGIDRMPRLLSRWRANLGAISPAACGFCVGLSAAWGNFYGVRTYRIPQISVNTGVLEREAGHLDAAVHHLREGLAGDARDTIGWIHLALALEQNGDVRAALQAYLDALALMPSDPMLRQMTGRFFQRSHLDAASIEAYAIASDEAARRTLAQRLLAEVSGPMNGQLQPD